MSKIYIGFDLGDGESITDYVSSNKTGNGIKTEFVDMVMPGINAKGKAIPTAFGYDKKGELVFANAILKIPELVDDIKINFKRCPSDLCRNMTAERQAEVINIFKNAQGFPSEGECPECCTPEMEEFRKAVVTFTNAVFENKDYKERIHGQTVDCNEIVFCVGHPTRWNDLDAAIYNSILKESVLGYNQYDGKLSHLIMAQESRAAFLTVKDKATQKVLPKGTSALLIDIGSSTIDITALSADSRNYQYNSGNNYLGARSIDFIIKKMYLEKMQKEDSEAWERYQDLKKNNPTFGESVTLACRMAKEEMYADYDPDMKVIIDPEGGIDYKLRIFTKEVDEYIKGYSVASILSENISLPGDEQKRMGNKNWMQLFRDFLVEEKSKISNEPNNIKVGRIILTGSASQMPFVPQIVKEVFHELSNGGVLADMDASRTISKGLALVGLFNEKSEAFTKDLNNLIDNTLEEIIKKNIPALADEMGTVVSEIITPTMKKRVTEWKEGQITTLNDMNNKIKSDCSESNLTKLLCSNDQYKKTIEKWLKDKVGVDVALELKGLCNTYGVKGISIEDLNIMEVPKFSLSGGLAINPLEFMDTISGIVSLLAGIISYASIGTIMAVITVVLSWISASLASSLFVALVGMGPVGWTVLAAVVGIGVAAIVRNGFDSIRDNFEQKVMSWDLPKIARQIMTENKINRSFEEANIPKQIKDAFNKPELSQNIVEKVSLSLMKEVEKRAESIKYEIESM